MGSPANAGDRKVMKMTAKVMIVVARKDMERSLLGGFSCGRIPGECDMIMDDVK